MMISPCTLRINPVFFSCSDCDRHMGPAHPEHHREKFVPQPRLIAGRIITGHQEPTEKALAYRTTALGDIWIYIDKSGMEGYYQFSIGS